MFAVSVSVDVVGCWFGCCLWVIEVFVVEIVDCYFGLLCLLMFVVDEETKSTKLKEEGRNLRDLVSKRESLTVERENGKKNIKTSSHIYTY